MLLHLRSPLVLRKHNFFPVFVMILTFCRLVYSDSKNSVFCFCCRLFDNKSKSKLVSDGFNKWGHLTETLKIHESSVPHMKCYQQGVETEIRIKTGKTMDNEELKIIEKESF